MCGEPTGERKVKPVTAVTTTSSHGVDKDDTAPHAANMPPAKGEPRSTPAAAQGAGERDPGSTGNSKPSKVPPCASQQKGRIKPLPEQRTQAPPQAAAGEGVPCPPKPPPPALGGDKKEEEDASTTRQALAEADETRKTAIQALADSANGRRGPGVGTRMMSMSGLEGNSERVRSRLKRVLEIHRCLSRGVKKWRPTRRPASKREGRWNVC